MCVLLLAQIREDEGGSVDGIRMTMFYYAQDLNNHSRRALRWGGWGDGEGEGRGGEGDGRVVCTPGVR